MNFIDYINYKMYSDFLKKGNSHVLAMLSAMIAVTVTLFLNTFTIFNIFCAFMHTEPMVVLRGSIKEKAFYAYAIIFLMNYFWAYYNQKYISKFNAISQKDAQNKHSDLLFSLYYWGSGVFTNAFFFLY